jgi:hypothetical protein
MHSSLQFFLEDSQLGSHPISARLPLELEDALSGPATDGVKPRKLDVSGFPKPRRARRSAAYRPNSIGRVFSGQR